jgi:hypothetical protein
MCFRLTFTRTSRRRRSCVAAKPKSANASSETMARWVAPSVTRNVHDEPPAARGRVGPGEDLPGSVTVAPFVARWADTRETLQKRSACETGKLKRSNYGRTSRVPFQTSGLERRNARGCRDRRESLWRVRVGALGRFARSGLERIRGSRQPPPTRRSQRPDGVGKRRAEKGTLRRRRRGTESGTRPAPGNRSILATQRVSALLEPSGKPQGMIAGSHLTMLRSRGAAALHLEPFRRSVVHSFPTRSRWSS